MKISWSSIAPIFLVVLGVSGCGDDLAAQAKKAAEEVASEAKKTAAKKIDDAKNETVDQLKQLRVGAEGEKEGKGDKGDASSGRDARSAAKKDD